MWPHLHDTGILGEVDVGLEVDVVRQRVVQNVHLHTEEISTHINDGLFVDEHHLSVHVCLYD
jgi:hypothetical protein